MKKKFSKTVDLIPILWKYFSNMYKITFWLLFHPKTDSKQMSNHAKLHELCCQTYTAYDILAKPKWKIFLTRIYCLENIFYFNCKLEL